MNSETSRWRIKGIIALLLSCTLTVSAQNPFFFECNLCYSPNRFISRPNTVVDTGGDVFTCSELDDIARNGEFGPQSCAIAQDWANDFCGCQGPPITPPPIITTPACEMCTFPEEIMGFPEREVYHPLIGGWECQDLFTAGRGGFLPDYLCEIVKPIVKECGCRFPNPSPAPSEEGDAVGGCRFNSDCADNQFCQFENEGSCSGRSSCVFKASACLVPVEPVCGCDGVTYSNACTAGVEGMSLRDTNNACEANYQLTFVEQLINRLLCDLFNICVNRRR